MRQRVQVWIGNLRHDTNRDDVWRELHSHFGWNPTSLTIRHGGPWPADQFGFVEFATAEEARRNFKFDYVFAILHLALLGMTSIFNCVRRTWRRVGAVTCCLVVPQKAASG